MSGRAAEFAGPEVLDTGRVELPAQPLAALLERCAQAEAACCGSDRNSICYQASLRCAAAATIQVVVKVPRLWSRRSNPDATFEAEARNLAALAARGLGSLPELHGRYRLRDRHFLVISHLPGCHPEPFANPLTPAQMDALLAWSLAAERVGFLHYDLKPANLLAGSGRVGILDLEFGRFESALDSASRSCGPGAGAPVTADGHGCDDYNVAMNAHWPRRSNVANLEFRTLDRHCRQLERGGRAAAARELVAAWCRAKSRYHRALSEYLASEACRAPRGAPDAHAAGARLLCAIAQEQVLAAVYARPGEALIGVERALMNCRARVFDAGCDDAVAALAALATARAAIAAAGSSLPAGYLSDASWVLDRLQRRLGHRGVDPGAARPRDTPAQCRPVARPPGANMR